MVLDLWLGVKIGCRETTIPILRVSHSLLTPVFNNKTHSNMKFYISLHLNSG